MEISGELCCCTVTKTIDKKANLGRFPNLQGNISPIMCFEIDCFSYTMPQIIDNF